jgi:hypothetical protein
MRLDPEVAVIVPPPQVPARPLGVDTLRPEGSVSVKPMPLNDAPPFGFVMPKVRVVLPLSGIVAGPNVFWITGGAGCTVMLALALGPNSSFEACVDAMLV